MAKIQIIKACWQCMNSACHDKEGKSMCTQESVRHRGVKEIIIYLDSIPAWCPLPDAPEPEECDDCNEICEGCGNAPEVKI